MGLNRINDNIVPIVDQSSNWLDLLSDPDSRNILKKGSFTPCPSGYTFTVEMTGGEKVVAIPRDDPLAHCCLTFDLTTGESNFFTIERRVSEEIYSA